MSDSNETLLFLLIGQSNMAGAPSPEAEDQVENPRVKVLAYEDCPNLGRRYDQWYPAKAPLHGCGGGVGPGDYFAKALASAFPSATIGLVPLAINGVDIDFFVKGAVSARRGEFRIPPDNHWAGAYDWVLERARLAQQSGTIRGILFHQGESDTGKAEWPGKVKRVVEDLRADLAIGEVPLVAGELLYSGCCGKWHNPLIQQLPSLISNARVVSADGLSGMDGAHFDLAGQRTLGARYGAAMLELLKARESGQP
ncbi:MAG TPA: sialate O-acetylesterase [Polyangiaceae bacterium]|nr:sialate O-acetylesterase [Polyangiaceae bacterium]